MKYKNTILYGMFLLFAGTFGSCDNNGIDDLDFSIGLNNPQETFKAGDPVTFNLYGDPDYLLFYSGEYGKKYANRNRTTADVQDLSLTYNLELKYATKRFRNGIRVLISEDFNGIYDEENINKATWSDMNGQLQVPVIESEYEGYAHGIVSDVQVDLSDYKYKNFYLAIEYNLPALNDEEKEQKYVHPDVYFYPKLNQTIDGKMTQKTSPKADFGFNFVRIKSNDTSSDNPTVTAVDDSKVSINGRNGKNGTYVWAISLPIDAAKVSADEGLSIKNYSAALPSYTHIYNEPGEYTATFVARNANAWNFTEQVREIKIKVVE